MKQKYIPGDLVSIRDSKGRWNIKPLHCLDLGLPEEIRPILLTPEILEKNGWKKHVFGSWENGKLSLDTVAAAFAFDTGNFWVKIKYVHELQHLLFGLGINNNMKV